MPELIKHKTRFTEQRVDLRLRYHQPYYAESGGVVANKWDDPLRSSLRHPSRATLERLIARINQA